MERYNIELETVTRYTVTIQAATEDDAVNLAHEMAYDDVVMANRFGWKVNRVEKAVE